MRRENREMGKEHIEKEKGREGEGKEERRRGREDRKGGGGRGKGRGREIIHRGGGGTYTGKAHNTAKWYMYLIFETSIGSCFEERFSSYDISILSTEEES